MQHKGTIEIETERLLLRTFRIEDAEAMMKNWVSDEKVTRYLTWKAYSDIEKAKDFIRFCIESNKNHDSYKWCIEYRETQEAIGSIDVVALSERNEIAEIGYCMSRKLWGKGIMTEALSAVINYLIKNIGFNRIQAAHHIDNVASGKVMQKCGMTFEGIKRQGIKDNKGNFCDIAMYAVLKKDIINF